MQSDAELSRILHSLQETDQDDLVTEERTRRQQARQSRVAADLESMDVDEDVVCLNGFCLLPPCLSDLHMYEC